MQNPYFQIYYYRSQIEFIYFVNYLLVSYIMSSYKRYYYAILLTQAKKFALDNVILFLK